MARPPVSNQRPTLDGPRINERITVPEIRLIDETGENVGLSTVVDAQARANSVGLDLVEIVPNSKPPVAKIMDYGKFKYHESKKKNEAKKKQKIVETKEVKVRPNIEQNDYDVKMRNVNKFIGEGNKVKVSLRFRGREMAHQQLGLVVLKRVRDDMGDLVKVEHHPSMEGRQMIMILAPK